MSTATASRPAGLAARPGGRRHRRRHRLRDSWDRYWYAWAMVAPVVVVLGVLVCYPLVRGLYYSLTDANEQNIGRTIGVNHIPATDRFVGLRNYADLLSGKDGAFYGRLAWTTVWTVTCVFFQYTLGLGLAMLLNRQVRGRLAYRLLLIVPWAVPTFVTAFGWRLMFNRDNGVLNALLGLVGIGKVDWLGKPLSAMIAVIVVNIWVGIPFIMVAMLGGLQSIPPELHEAAEVDGATPFQRFRHVTLPGLSAVSGTVILLGVIWTFNQFAIIFLVTEGGPGGSTEILVTYAYRQAFSSIRDYSGAATYGAMILALLVVFASGYRRVLRRQGGAL